MIAVSEAVLARPTLRFDNTPLPTALEKIRHSRRELLVRPKQALFDITLDVPGEVGRWR